MTLALIDELADQATRMVQDGVCSSPEEAVDAIFATYCTDGGCEPGLGNFLTDTWNALVGKPQSWYTNVSNIQNHLNVVLAGVTAVGSDAWAAAQGAASGIDDYDSVVSDLTGALTSILVTESSYPSDDTISAASATATKYDTELQAVNAQATPDVQAQVESDQATVSAGLPAPMQSPSAVGQTVFAQQIADRASALGQGILDWTKYAAYGVGGLALLWLLSKTGGKRAA